MKAIDNSKLIDYCRSSCNITSFIPSIHYSLDATEKKITVSDDSKFGSGDQLKKVHVKIHDNFGSEVRETITATGEPGKKVIDISSLNNTKGLTIRALVISKNNLHADGSATNIQTVGILAYWDKK